MSTPGRATATVTMVLVTLALTGVGARADFPEDPPDDPFYDQSEESFPTCEVPPTDQQYQLFDFLPACAPQATDPENASGNSVNAAWRDYTTGRSDVTIAYVEGGINWHEEGGDGTREIADKVYVNRGELGAAVDRCFEDNGDPWFNAADFGCTPDHNDNGFVDAEDLIVEFSDGVDDDDNGYVDDISGWDFYHDQNNPSQTDTAYTHANGQMRAAAAITDNGQGEAGICPTCMLLPIKAGAEALDRTDDLAQAWLFAADAGAEVIVSVTADLGYSTFMRQAVEAIAEQGVVMVEASNDFNSTDHQGGMFHPHVLPGNGMVANSVGTEAVPPVADTSTLTYRVRSGYTSWGPHNEFTPGTIGGTTSEATPTVGGIMALVISYGRDAAEAGLIQSPLDGHEAIQVVRATSSDVDDPTNPWPNQPGFDLQYGYGRPNVVEAMGAIEAGEIPPVATLRSPRWYTLADPSQQGSIEVTGTVRAPRSSGYDWELQWALGPQPTDDEFTTFASGSSDDGGKQQVAADFDLSQIPADYHQRPMALSQTKTLETAERYTVSFRLQARDTDDRLGEDRRTIFTHRDDSWVDGFPWHIGPGGEGQPALVDLTGLGRLQIVFSDTDGFVHAIDPLAEGGPAELPGWPVALHPTPVTREHHGVDPGREPAPGNVAVGDLDGDGRLQVVVTTSSGTVYVIDEGGSIRDGFPKTLDNGVRPPANPRPQREIFREPWQGAFASPALFDLDDDNGLEIIQAGWDGRLHVWNGDGSAVEGWPVEVVPPEGYAASNGRFLIEDHKISATPAIADLDGDDDPEIVVNSQFNETRGTGFQPNGASTLFAYHHDGTPVDGWPTSVESTVMFYGSAQEFITEGINMPIAADIDGDGDDEIATNPLFTFTYVLDGDGSVQRAYAPPGVDPTALPDSVGGLSDLIDGLSGDAPIGFTTSGAFGRFAGQLSFAQPGSGAASVASSLLTPGSGQPIVNYERAVNAASGATQPGFAAELQGLNFLGAPLFVDVTGDGDAEIIDGGDSSAVHAYTAGGGQAAGWPKFNTGWALWSPTAGDLDGDGTVEIVQATREGELFAWHTEGTTEANDQWWSWRHDGWNTGRYGIDARPPGTLRGLDVDREGGTLSFTAPGDDWYTGNPDHYLVQTAGGETQVATSAAAGETVTVELPDGATSVQAVDDAGNLGRPVTLDPSGPPDPAGPRSGVGPPPAAPDTGGDSPLPATGGGVVPFALAALSAGLFVAATRRRRPRSLR